MRAAGDVRFEANPGVWIRYGRSCIASSCDAGELEGDDASPAVVDALCAGRLAEGSRARLGHVARGRRHRGDSRRAHRLCLGDQRKACRLPQWATRRPIFAASSSAKRKWMPDHTRASTMSAHTSEKLVNVRVTLPGVVPLNVASSRP